MLRYGRETDVGLMTVRTSQETVTFQSPFFADGFEEVLRARDYRVETDEKLIHGTRFLFVGGYRQSFVCPRNQAARFLLGLYL
jgi:hypothetical protein